MDKVNIIYDTNTNITDKKCDNKIEVNTTHYDKNSVSGEFDSIVLSGNGINSIVTLGALQYCFDTFLLEKVHTYVGTSSGAIIAYLLAIGYTPEDIMIAICTNSVTQQMSQINLLAILNGNGISTFDPVYLLLEKMTIDKVGTLLTFRELYERFNNIFICTTYNLSNDHLEIIDYKNHPNMNCLIALKMSANLPLIFDKFKYNGMYYQDGGLGNNYPVNIVDDGINKILGIRLKNHFDMGSTNIMDYIFKIIHTPIRQNEDIIIQKSSDKCKHILLESKDTSPFNYNLPVTQKLNMFSYGYRQIQKKI